MSTCIACLSDGDDKEATVMVEGTAYCDDHGLLVYEVTPTARRMRGAAMRSQRAGGRPQ